MKQEPRSGSFLDNGKAFEMRQGPHSKRGRGRGNNRRPNIPNRNQTFDSNGPDVRIRGNAHQVYEKYLALARDASASGDRVLAESLYQHADHYYRIYSAFNEADEQRRSAFPQDQHGYSSDDEYGAPREYGHGGHGDDHVQHAAPHGPTNGTGRPVEAAPADQQPALADESVSEEPRRTRSERRAEAEAAERQGGDRSEQFRRRRNGSGNGTDDDAALRQMLRAGGGDGQRPAPVPAPAEETPVAVAGEEEPRTLRRRGRPRRVAEQGLPLGEAPGGED